MVRLDVGTLAFASAMLALALAPIIAFIAGRRGLGGSQRLFAGAAAAYGLGVLQIILWPTAPAAIIAGNLLVMTSACATHAGVAVRLGRRPAWAAYTVGLAAVAGGFALSLFGEVGGVGERIMLISGARLPFLAHGAMMLRGRGGRSGRVLQGGLLFFTALLALRIVDVMAVEGGIADFLGTVGMQALYFTGVSVFLVLLGVSSLLAAAEAEEADLRERIDAQTVALRQAKEVAEQALTAKSRFLAAAGHDLRQAVHAMRMLLSAVNHELSVGPEERRDLAELTEGMARVAATMGEQLNALLEIARLDNGMITPRVGPCPLTDLFARLMGQYGHGALANDVDLRFVATSAVAVSDPALLLRLMGNLIDNAIKFGGGGRVLVGCRRRGGMVVLQVWDEGPGFNYPEPGNPPAGQEELGRHGTTEGLGLGLAIVRRIAELLGHDLQVKSRTGHGTVFSVSLPGAF